MYISEPAALWFIYVDTECSGYFERDVFQGYIIIKARMQTGFTCSLSITLTMASFWQPDKQVEQNQTKQYN